MTRLHILRNILGLKKLQFSKLLHIPFSSYRAYEASELPPSVLVDRLEYLGVDRDMAARLLFGEIVDQADSDFFKRIIVGRLVSIIAANQDKVSANPLVDAAESCHANFLLTPSRIAEKQ